MKRIKAYFSTYLSEAFAIRIGIITAIFAALATLLISSTEFTTRGAIQANQQAALLQALSVILPESAYNNNLVHDTLILPANPSLHTQRPTTVYRARLNDEPIAAIFTVVAPDGYSGRITLLIGIYTDNTVSGVRVIHHQETPGLGDKIEAQRHPWILQFSGLSLKEPAISQWAVKKDGGEFDQFTGATITPRAVINAIKNALAYFETHQHDLFAVNAHEPL